MPQATFGDYTLGDFLGKGAVGTVFKCWKGEIKKDESNVLA